MQFSIPSQESAKLNLNIARYQRIVQRDIGEVIATRSLFVMRHASSGHLGYTYATPKSEPPKYWNARNRAAQVHVAIHGAMFKGERVAGRMTKATPRELMVLAIGMRRRAADRSRAFIRAGWLGGMKAIHATGKVRAHYRAADRAQHFGVAHKYGSAVFTPGENPVAEFWNTTGSYVPKVPRPPKGSRTHRVAAAKHGEKGLRLALAHEEANLAAHIAAKLQGLRRGVFK